MSERVRTILKKFYVTESQNEVLNQLVDDTGLVTFSNYARRMLFKETSLFLSEEENQKLLERMKQDGFSNFSRFARKQLLKPDFEVWTVSFPEYLSLTDRLLFVGRAINNLAKSTTQFGKIS